MMGGVSDEAQKAGGFYGNNIIKELNYPNFLKEKFGSLGVFIILYP